MKQKDKEILAKLILENLKENISKTDLTVLVSAQ